IWWQIGLTARCDRVDQHLLRYETSEFQRLRQGLATVLDAILLRHAVLSDVPLANGLSGPVMRWIDNDNGRSPGQIQYHRETANQRARYYGVAEFAAWSLFGISFGVATWLADHVAYQILGDVISWLLSMVSSWLVTIIAIVGAGAVLKFVWREDVRAPDVSSRVSHLLWSWLAGVLLAAAVVAPWPSFEGDHELL